MKTHCLQPAPMAWRTYCGLSIERRAHRGFRTVATGYELENLPAAAGPRCQKCAQAVARMAAAWRWTDPPAVAGLELPAQVLGALAGLATFQAAAKKAGLITDAPAPPCAAPRHEST